MAGSKQHFIPQDLLRAFRNRPKGKVAQVHVYRRDRTYPSATDGVAAEKFFYSALSLDGSETLDGIITAYENGPLERDFRALETATPGPVDPHLAARVITHLVVRGDHLRGVVSAGASQMGAMIDSLFGSTEGIRSLIAGQGARPAGQIRALISEALDDNPIFALLDLPRPVLEDLLYQALRENLGAAFEEIQEGVEKIVSRFRDEGRLLARDAQIESLSKTLVPAARASVLETLAWRIEDVDAPTFLLPDFIALGLDRAGQAGTLFTIDRDDLATVQMPLSPTRMLVGRRNDQPVDYGRFNAEAAPHCLDFFVTSFTAPAFDVLAARIGTQIADPIRAALGTAVEEFRGSFGSPGMPEAPSDKDPEWRQAPSHSFDLHTELVPEDVARLIPLLQQMTAMARREFDIAPLLRIIVAADYAKAVPAVDRGALAQEGPVLASPDGMGIACNVAIEQGGVYGIAMVLHDRIVDELFSDDAALFGSGASIFFAQLAKIGADSLLATVFARGIETGDARDRLLLGAATDIWKSYFVGGYRGLFGPAMRVHYRKMFLDRLPVTQALLAQATLAFRTQQDVDMLLEAVMPELTVLLADAACAAASFEEGADDQPSRDSFMADMAAYGLARWFDLFRADLAGVWAAGTAYPAQEAFLALNRHLERFLSPAGVFLWDKDGSCHVEVRWGAE